MTASGGLGGVQAGCNYQVGRWVLGAQGDWDWTSATASTANPAFPLFTDQSDTKSLASLTLRTGYAGWDRFLLYVKSPPTLTTKLPPARRRGRQLPRLEVVERSRGISLQPRVVPAAFVARCSQ